jgi:Zn-dependent protease
VDPAILITAYIVFVYSTVCHEAAHALVAHRLGDDTAYLGGQVTLDPIPHIRREPMGMVVVPILALFLGGRIFGWASAPLDPLWVARFPRRSALVAIAGPIANFILCALAAVGMFVGVKNGVFAEPTSTTFSAFVVGQKGTAWELVAVLLSLVFSLNVLLGILNLMPLAPLDGSNIPLLFLKERAADSYQQMLRQPFMFLITLVVLMQIFYPVIFRPFYSWITLLCYRWFGFA